MTIKSKFFSTIHWLRDHPQPWIRIVAGVLLICGGILGFLPILGFWMIPLGLMLLAVDFPWAKRLLVRFKLLIRSLRKRYKKWKGVGRHTSNPNQ
jgi:hypothetical protein